MAAPRLPAPAKEDFFEFAHRHRKEVVWMSQNTNTIPLTPRIRDAMIRSIQEGEFNLYPYRNGLFGLAEAIKEDLGRAVADRDVLITGGGLEGLYMMNRALLRAGDRVIATDPSFLPFHNQAGLSGAVVEELDIYRKPWKLTAEQVEQAVGPQTRMLFLEDPHNPLGSGYSRQEKRALMEVAQDRGLYVVDDITYRDFNPDHVLAAELYPEKSITAYSFSKGPGLAGLRVGALIAPPEILKAIKPYDTNVLGINIVGQRAALAALESRGEWLPHVREVCRKNQAIIHETIEGVANAFLPVFPAKANHFSIDISATGVDPDELEGRMLHDYRVHVRAGPYLSKRVGKKFIRASFTVAVEDCERFRQAFPRALAALQARAN
jgi:aspartate/methionine/tyrosine aminotransferase